MRTKRTFQRVRPSVLALLVALAAGCASDGGRPAEPPEAALGTRLYDPMTGRELTELDFGEDWLMTGDVGVDPGPDGAGRAALAFPTAPEPEPYWAIVLGTYTKENHRQAASTMADQVGQIAPQLGDVRVHTNDKGSMVIYGRYEAADDPQAKEALAMVKRMAIGERRVFSRAMLARVTPPGPRGATNPHSLAAARARYPDVDPLYTLQVGVWSDFGSGKLDVEEVRRRAENDAARLRGQGHMAFFHHTDGRALSVVTVGLFDRNALDAQSGIPSSEVTLLMKQFPAHMVNGEPLQELIDRRRPDMGTQVQRPMLVEVP